MKQIIVISSPSGGGKTTLANHLRKIKPKIEFSVSATTRRIRPGEVNSKDYYFLSIDEFKERAKQNEFLEYEEIYGNLYGTLKSEVENKIKQGKVLLFDVDVKGALNLKKHFPDISLLLFIAPPDIETLKQRLIKRNTEDDKMLSLRIERAKMELSLINQFDVVIINDDLGIALKEIELFADKYLIDL
jgi:guanylate kinase